MSQAQLVSNALGAHEVDPKAAALQHRLAIIDLMRSAAVLDEVAEMRPGGTGLLASIPLLSAEQANFFHSSFAEQPNWEEEKWLILPDGSVRLTTDASFDEADPESRFSYNDCLRKVSKEALPVRALISALQSPEVAASLSDAYGEPITLVGIDMARYKRGHYLRRHADTFNERRFGFIFFLAPDWAPGDGGELVIESPSGEAQVAYPTQGTVALLRIARGFQHEVCRLRSPTWIRYVFSAHFGTPSIAG